MGASHGKALARSTVADLLLETRRSKAVLCLPDTLNVGDALHELAKHGVLSAPLTRRGALLSAKEISNLDGHGEKKKKSHHAAHHDLLTRSSEVIGVFGVEDVVEMLFMPFASEDATELYLGHDQADDKDAFSVGHDLFKQPLALFQGWSHHHASFRADAEMSLTELVVKMDELKLHRCLIESAASAKDGERSIIGMLSQSSILTWIQHHLRDERSLEDLALGFRRVTCVRDTDTAIHAIRIMYDSAIGGVGIVDSNGRLVSAFSLSLLRGFTEDMFADLALPAPEFADKHRKPGSTPVNKVTGATKFVDCVDTMVRHGLHRVWIVNNFDKPVGIITISDLVTRLARMATYDDLHADLFLAEIPEKNRSKHDHDEKGDQAVVEFNASTVGKLGDAFNAARVEKARQKAVMKAFNASRRHHHRTPKHHNAPNEADVIKNEISERLHDHEPSGKSRAARSSSSRSKEHDEKTEQNQATPLDEQQLGAIDKPPTPDRASHKSISSNELGVKKCAAQKVLTVDSVQTESTSKAQAHGHQKRSEHHEPHRKHTTHAASLSRSEKNVHTNPTAVETELANVNLVPNDGRTDFVSPRSHRLAKETEEARQHELEGEHLAASEEQKSGKASVEFSLGVNPNLAAVESAHAGPALMEQQHNLLDEAAHRS